MLKKPELAAGVSNHKENPATVRGRKSDHCEAGTAVPDFDFTKEMS